jgi:peptide/nickel transport system permease protein
VIAYIVRRLFSGLFIVWGVYTITFLAVNLAPGDPFTARENPKVQEEDLMHLRRAWGYDRPVIERYFLHLKKMFWKEPQVVEAEGGGIGLEVRAEDGRNMVRAHFQHPPAAIDLVPSQKSVVEEGAKPVRLSKGPEGWSESPIAKGRYTVGARFVVVGTAPVTLDVQGLTLRITDGVVRAAPTRTAAPAEVRLVRAGGAVVVVPRTGEGVYGPVALPGDAYTFSDDATSTPVSLGVPDELLEGGGLGFDLGTSIQTGNKVTTQLKQPLRNTLILAIAALLVQFLVGCLMGVYSAVKQGTWGDRVFTLSSFFVYSMPVFWLAVMLQLIFPVKLGVLYVAGMYSEGDGTLLDLLAHMVLPVVVLGVGGAAAIARYQRSSMLEILGQDYVRTARAKGLGERAVIWKHALKNALLPTITLIGLSLPFLVSGSVIVEQIFSWPGMGREAITAIANRDVFIVSGITLIATCMVVVGSLIADVLYAAVDPRVRLQ